MKIGQNQVRVLAGAAGAVLLLGLAPARAAEPKPDRASVLAAVVDCRKVTEPTARLACYDQATAEFDRAERAGEVAVVDRGQAKVLRKQAFGFDLSLSFFNRGSKEDAIDRVTLTLDHSSLDRDGRWRFTTTEGAVWQQTDEERVSPEPHKGSQLAVRRAALGSYFCNVDGQRAVRCQRQH